MYGTLQLNITNFLHNGVTSKLSGGWVVGEHNIYSSIAVLKQVFSMDLGDEVIQFSRQAGKNWFHQKWITLLLLFIYKIIPIHPPENLLLTPQTTIHMVGEIHCNSVNVELSRIQNTMLCKLHVFHFYTYSNNCNNSSSTVQALCMLFYSCMSPTSLHKGVASRLSWGGESGYRMLESPLQYLFLLLHSPETDILYGTPHG